MYLENKMTNTPKHNFVNKKGKAIIIIVFERIEQQKKKNRIA